MSYAPGDRVEFARAVDGVGVGQRGKVTSTGFLGGLDIQLTSGARVVGVDASAVKAAPPGWSHGSTGCAVTALAGLASIVGSVVVAWSPARWGR